MLSIDLLDDDEELELDAGLKSPAKAARGGVAPTRQRAKGALRLLGIIKSVKGLPILMTASEDEDAEVREAAADGLKWYEDETALDRLRSLAADKDDRVVFAAALGLRQHKIRHDRLLALARKRTSPKDPRWPQIAALMAEMGQAQDVPVLQRLCRDTDSELRLTATRGLIRLKALDETNLVRLLDDGHEAVVSLALSTLSEKLSAAVMARVRTLANDPVESVAELARLSASQLRPKDERDGIAFDLEIEHPYIRLQRLEQLCNIKEFATWRKTTLSTSKLVGLSRTTRI